MSLALEDLSNVYCEVLIAISDTVVGEEVCLQDFFFLKLNLLAVSGTTFMDLEKAPKM